MVRSGGEGGETEEALVVAGAGRVLVGGEEVTTTGIGGEEEEACISGPMES